MSIISDTYVVDASEQGFVRVDYSSQRSTTAGPHEFKATVWFERSNLGWLIEALEACVADHGLPERSTTSGEDVLRVHESGPEPAPYINLENERAEGAPHGGFQWFAMSKPLAVKLISELSELRAQNLANIDQWQKRGYDEATEHAELMKNVRPSSLVEPPPPRRASLATHPSPRIANRDERIMPRSLDSSSHSTSRPDGIREQRTACSQRQLRVLNDVRVRLDSRWPVSPVHRKEHFRHWEDEATGIPPLGESAWFTVKLPVIELTIGTPLPWEDEPAHRVVASFSHYEAGNSGEPWALVVDAQARVALSNAGFEAGMCGRTRSLRDATDSVISEAIAESVSRLSTVPFQVLRPHDLPANSKWPWRGLIGVLAADKIVSIEDRADARHEITSETDGRRAQTVVDAKDMELLRWWWDVGSRALLEKERR